MAFENENLKLRIRTLDIIWKMEIILSGSSCIYIILSLIYFRTHMHEEPFGVAVNNAFESLVIAFNLLFEKVPAVAKKK